MDESSYVKVSKETVQKALIEAELYSQQIWEYKVYENLLEQYNKYVAEYWWITLLTFGRSKPQSMLGFLEYAIFIKDASVLAKRIEWDSPYHSVFCYNTYDGFRTILKNALGSSSDGTVLLSFEDNETLVMLSRSETRLANWKKAYPNADDIALKRIASEIDKFRNKNT